MTTIHIVTALIVYVFIPLAGLLFFLRLRKQMRIEIIQAAPIKELFVIFATYGGLLLLALTSIIWPLAWSGMASLGTLYLVLVAPIAMGSIANRFRQSRKISKYHNWLYISGLSYFAIAPVTILILYLVSKN